MTSGSNPSVRQATIPEDLPLLRQLFREYQQSVDAPVCFNTFDAELAALPAGYVRFWIAEDGSHPSGCAALRELDSQRCELKRLYVRPESRGLGLARRIVEHALAEGARLGYRELVLDTLPTMIAAIQLYRAMGFREVERYNRNPFPGTLFFAKELGFGSGSEPGGLF